MARVGLNSIGKSFGATRVLDGVDLDVAHGEFLTLVGASGCGKSTLIRIIAGLEPQSEGSVSIDGAAIDRLRPHERRVAMVFQSYALYPHMSVFANIALPLTMQRLALWERLPLVKHLSPHRRRALPGIERDVRAVADQLQIEPLLARKPAQLSGGQRQRVALGRAMVRQPAVFLMDEPLSNLDAKLRVHMRSELAELHKRLGSTFIYVTHDQVEAMTMSDRVAMMDGGRILQLGAPGELYARPASIKVAQFIGSPAKAGATRASEIALPALLRRSENLGAEFILHYDVAGLGSEPILSRVSAGHEFGEGETPLVFDAAAAHVFDADGARAERIDADGRAASVTRLHPARSGR
jgi:multiple sugar transport system ATP-binding protein